MSQTYYAILTAVGEAKIANAASLGTPLQISRMAVGDGNGSLPVPMRTQTALVRETYRANLNTLQPDPANNSQIIAEMVIPETVGGWWIRELGLYDASGSLVAVANCPPSYKPLMAEGSGRTQVLRMVLVVASTTAIELKIDPSVVLATRAYVDDAVTLHQGAADPHPQYTTEAEVNALIAAVVKGSPFRKNVLINGNFDIWQRQTSFPISVAGSNVVADRWLANIGVTGNTSTITRQSFTPGQGVVPNEPTHWLRYTLSAYVSGAASLEQRIESVRTLAGKKVTVSFWAKADSARVLTVSLTQMFGTGGTPSGDVPTPMKSVSLTTSWQQFTATVTLPSIAGKTFGSNGNDCLQLLFVLPGAPCTIDLAQVQLEASPVATDFELLPAQQVLALCQRYYEKSYEVATLPGAATNQGAVYLSLGSGTVERLQLPFKVPKRATPTVVAYSPSGTVAKLQASGTDQPCGLERISINSAQAVNQGTLYKDFAVHFTADAEL